VKVWKAKKEYQKEILSITKVQSVLRSANAKRKYRQDLDAHQSAASTLQRRIRGTRTRKQHKKQLFGVVPIQALWRGAVTRMNVGLLLASYSTQRRHAATRIQGLARMRNGQAEFGLLKKRISVFQMKFRQRAERREYLRTLGLFIAVQCKWRTFVARRKLRRKQKESLSNELRELINRVGATQEDYHLLVDTVEVCEKAGITEEFALMQRAKLKLEEMTAVFDSLDNLEAASLTVDVDKIQAALDVCEELQVRPPPHTRVNKGVCDLNKMCRPAHVRTKGAAHVCAALSLPASLTFSRRCRWRSTTWSC